VRFQVTRSIREISRFAVLSHKGKKVGRVYEVLFHPEGRRVVGYQVARPRLVYLFDRKDWFLAADAAAVEPGFVKALSPDAWGKRAQRVTGVPWDETVIWYGMPVKTKSGVALGTVRDGLFDEKTGALEALGLSSGVTADTALGVRDLPASLVEGFNGQAIVVADEAAVVTTSGGAAEAAGRGVAVAKVQASETAVAAAEAARKAAVYGKAAVKVAASTDTGKKAVGWLKAMRDEVVDAMGPPDDDNKR
jgi:uncharacterized protein YrrD